MANNKKPIPESLEQAIEKTLSSPQIREEKREELLRLEKEAAEICIRGKAMRRMFLFELIIFVIMLVLIIVGACIGSSGTGLIVVGSIFEFVVVAWGVLSLVWNSRANARVQNIVDILQSEIAHNRGAEYPVAQRVFIYGPYTGNVRAPEAKINNDASGFITHYQSIGATVIYGETGDFNLAFRKYSATFQIGQGEIALIGLSLVKGQLIVDKKVIGTGDASAVVSKPVVASHKTAPVAVSTAKPAGNKIYTYSEDRVEIPVGRDPSTYLQRAEIYLEDGEFEKANSYVEGVLDLEPTNGKAYYLKLLLSLRVKSEEELSALPYPFDDVDAYKKVMRFGDEETKTRIASISDAAAKRAEEERERLRAEEEEKAKAREEEAKQQAEEERLEAEKKAEEEKLAKEKEEEEQRLQKEKEEEAWNEMVASFDKAIQTVKDTFAKRKPLWSKPGFVMALIAAILVTLAFAGFAAIPMGYHRKPGILEMFAPLYTYDYGVFLPLGILAFLSLFLTWLLPFAKKLPRPLLWVARICSPLAGIAFGIWYLCWHIEFGGGTTTTAPAIIAGVCALVASLLGLIALVLFRTPKEQEKEEVDK